MIGWDKNNPLPREIMDASKEAWLNSRAIEAQERLDEIKAKLPWWARLYLRIAGWLGGL